MEDLVSPASRSSLLKLILLAAPLIRSRQISKMILSFVGSNKTLEAAYLSGEIALELSPQGTLAERMACGGKGVPGVLRRRCE